MTLASWREVEAWILRSEKPSGSERANVPGEPRDAGWSGATGPLPETTRSMVEGWAIEAAETQGASPGLPVLLAPGRAAGVAAGGAVPEGADAVLPMAAARWRGSLVELSAEAAPGDNLVPAGAWLGPGEALRVPGAHPFGAGGEPGWAGRVWLGPACGALPERLWRGLVSVGLAGEIGGEADGGAGGGAEWVRIKSGLDRPGTGAADGLHGLGLCGGEAASVRRTATGGAEIVLPEAPGPAMAVLLAVVAPLLRRLAGIDAPPSVRLRLSGKLVSPPGLAQVALLLPAGEGGWVEPVPLDWLTPLRAIAAACAWTLLPPEAEGVAEGEVVEAWATPWATSTTRAGPGEVSPVRLGSG